MEPISNADRLVLLLRQKLEERVRSTARSGSAARGATTQPLEPTGVRALAAVEGCDDHSLRRAVVQHLLADQIDQSLINDAQFQQVVGRVTEAIEDDADASALLTRVLVDLRAG